MRIRGRRRERTAKNIVTSSWIQIESAKAIQRRWGKKKSPSDSTSNGAWRGSGRARHHLNLGPQ